MLKSLIIGASGDLGTAVAEILAKRGDDVLIHGMTRQSRLDELAERVRASGMFTVDVTDDTAVASMFDQIDALDNLIFCAGINPTADSVGELTLDAWRRIIDVNLTGAFTCVKAALPKLHASPSPSIVLVSSIFGLESPARRSAYGASKHGLIGLVQSLTKEEGTWLRVNAVCPGPMWSENLRNIVQRHAEAEEVPVEDYILKRVQDVPAGRLMELRECAAVIAFLCSDGASFVRGEAIRVAGGAVQ